MDLEDNVTLEGDVLVIIDRRRLPREIVRLRCPDYEAVARAIEEMAVQGAGDIAITAGFGLYLAARKLERGGTARKTATLREAANRLIATRPTGFHLAALVNKLMSRIEEAAGAKPASEVILASLRKGRWRASAGSPKTRAATPRRFFPPATGFSPTVSPGRPFCTCCEWPAKTARTYG